MKIASIVGVVLALSAAACTDIEVVPKGTLGDGGGCPNPTPPDLATSQPACKAAEGISGTPLICQDFAGVNAPTIAQLTQKGWNFDKAATGCWQIQGSLNVKNFGSSTGSCALTLPEQDLTKTDKNPKTITLSLVHKVDMVQYVQRGEIFLDQDFPSRLIHLVGGEQKITSSVKTSLPVARETLTGGKATFYLKASSENVSVRNGWQIESIAVIASP
ncbi:MAG: hypothetical protein U1A78_02050 [Polyangia bacterium]